MGMASCIPVASFDGYVKSVSLQETITTHYTWVYPSESFSRALCFWFSTFYAVGEFEEWLPDWIREGHSP